MKGIKFVISSLFLLCSLGVIAQNQFTITGNLIDGATKEKIEAASISVLSVKDSSEVTGSVTNKNGDFFLKVNRKGNFLLGVTYVGYKPIYKPFTTSETTTVSLGTLEIFEDAIELGEALVKGKKPEVIVKDDTVEFDAGSYKTTENAIVEELLKKLPGVEVGDDGKITVNGKEVKKFLVDGKEFFSDDPKVASKNLPAEMVDKLQVVERKSEMARMTGFDDGEEETVINLTIKPGMKKGTLGNVAAGIGQDLEADRDMRYEVGGLFNYMKDATRYSLLLKGNNTNNLGASDLGANQFGGRRGWRGFDGGITQAENIAFNMNKEFSPKFSLNTDIMYNAKDQDATSWVEETNISAKDSYLDETKTTGNYISDDWNVRMRMDWKPNDKNTIVFRPFFQYNQSQREANEIFGRFDAVSMDSISSKVSTTYNEGNGYRAGGDLDYSYKFNKPGRVFSASLRGSISDDYSQGLSDQKYHFYNIGLDSIANQRTENDGYSNSFRGYLSFVEPIGHNNFIQLAYSATTGKTEGINSTYKIYDYNSLWGGNLMDTATLVGDRSRSTLRYTLQQRYSLKFKAVREKYNYTIGVNVDPSNSINKTYQPTVGSHSDIYLPITFDDRLPNVMGDSLISRISQNVINFSPEINFNYQFGQRTNLRVDYEGETNQPSANQLRDYTDFSDIMNPTKGNPNLKPGYSNQLRARFNKFVPESQMFYNVNLMANYSINDITAVTAMQDGVRLTTYENVNGNWNAMLMGGFNTPLKNKKFTVGNFINLSFTERKSFVNMQENTMSNFGLGDRAMANYRSSLFDFGVNANVRYGQIEYTLQPERNQETFNWGVGANTTWYLPHNITVESDFNWTNRTGYGKEFDISEAMWNASIMKQLFNKKYGTGLLKLKIYDILQDRNNVVSSPTTNGFSSTMTTTIPSFFMCTFIYKFSIFPGGSSATEKDVRGGDERRWEGPRGGGGGGGRGSFGPF